MSAVPVLFKLQALTALTAVCAVSAMAVCHTDRTGVLVSFLLWFIIDLTMQCIDHVPTIKTQLIRADYKSKRKIWPQKRQI
jgi:hypothetical protein